MIMIMIRLIYT